jgi:hypothetical protein
MAGGIFGGLPITAISDSNGMLVDIAKDRY